MVMADTPEDGQPAPSRRLRCEPDRTYSVNNLLGFRSQGSNVEFRGNCSCRQLRDLPPTPLHHALCLLQCTVAPIVRHPTGEIKTAATGPIAFACSGALAGLIWPPALPVMPTTAPVPSKNRELPKPNAQRTVITHENSVRSSAVSSETLFPTRIYTKFPVISL